MLKIGLTGGLASGKSYVAQCLQALGCHVLKADELGHEALEPGGAAYGPAVEAFGRAIVGEDGRIDRRKLGALVFEDGEKLKLLNSIVHPVVIGREEAWMREVEAGDGDGIAVVEAAILIETGSYKRFERLVLAVCSEEQQIERAMKRDQLTREDVLKRLEKQMPLKEKRKYADYVIDTSGAKSETVERVGRLHEELRRLK